MTLHKAANVNVQNKVVLTQAQANALEEAKKEFGNDRIISNHITWNGSEWLRQCRALNGMQIDTLIRALYIGYTIEQTVEEKLLYCYAETSSINEDFREGYRSGIAGALKIIGMKVKGINA